MKSFPSFPDGSFNLSGLQKGKWKYFLGLMDKKIISILHVMLGPMTFFHMVIHFLKTQKPLFLHQKRWQ